MSDVVYILTNESMPGLIKIGRTSGSIEKRMRELYKTGVPIPFECAYAAEVADSKDIEKVMHDAYRDSRLNPNREFFRISPESARVILSRLGEVDVTPIDTPVETQDDNVAIDKARKIRSAFNFDMVNIQPDSELTFSRNDEIVATVVDSKKIQFRGEVSSLSASALIVMKEMGYEWNRIAGPYFWKYKGEILADLRDRLEQE